MQRVSIGRRLTHRWMLLVAVVVAEVAGFAGYRLHGIFASHAVTSTGSAGADQVQLFNPKHVVMEVFGPPGTVATYTYTDAVALPWAYVTSTPSGRSSSTSPPRAIATRSAAEYRLATPPRTKEPSTP